MYLIHVLSVLFENSFIILGREWAAEFSSKLDDFGLRIRERRDIYRVIHCCGTTLSFPGSVVSYNKAKVLIS